MVEAFPDDTAPRYLLRDRDKIYGEEFRRRVKGMDIQEVLIAPRSPWQNPYSERLIGSIRRECWDHEIVLGENICDGFCSVTSPITDRRELTCRWLRMLCPLGRYNHRRWEASWNCPGWWPPSSLRTACSIRRERLHSSPPRSPSISGIDRVDPMLISHVPRKAFATTPSHSEVIGRANIAVEGCRSFLTQPRAKSSIDLHLAKHTRLPSSRSRFMAITSQAI